MTAFARQVLDALPITVYTTDLEGCITSANRSWSRFAEENGAPMLSAETAVCGQSLFSAIADPSYRDQVVRAMDDLKAGRTWRASWEFPCSSPNEERVFLMQITALREGHHVIGFVFSTVDITPSHRSREALIDTGLALSRTIDLDQAFQEIGQQVRRAIASDSFAVYLRTDDGAPLQLAYLTGYEDSDSLGSDRMAHAQEATDSDRVVVRQVSPDAVEIAAPMSGGERTIGAMLLRMDSARPHQELGEAQRVLATLAAQTAVSIERAWLVRRVGAKRRLEAIGEVATGVAHELRNPLFGISSAAQLLRFRSKEDPVVEKNVGRILREVERLNRMVTSLLEFGRPKPIALALGDPDAVWDDVLDTQRGLIEARALALRRTRVRPPISCAIDAEQLAQVFLNILVNAVDHAPEGSEIVMRTAALPNGSWRLRLTNGGPAIPPDVLPRVFEIFFSTKPGGTGIGLALCQRIVEEHGGTISIESTPEAGTSVVVTLPAADGASLADAAGA